MNAQNCRNRRLRLSTTHTRKIRMKQLPVFTALTILLAGGPMGVVAAEAAGPVRAIGVENEYADVISQIGGKYVQVQAIETDPNTDPHTFEASPKIAKEIAAAQLIV